MTSRETFERYAQMRVPRYTSYPTAPQFAPAIDQAEYRRWLRDLDSPDPLSVYVHIPFCREMCWYCGCHTTVTRRHAPVSRYVDTLIDEVNLVAAEMRVRPRIGHMHLGGGSPTLLSPSDLGKLDAALRAHFEFAGDCEIAIEVDPRTLNPEFASALGGVGVNRASLGAQSFDPKVQAAINRTQSFGTTSAAVDLLRSAGVRGINLDLIYGLPFQTAQSCVDTVKQSLRLEPDRFAVFGYAHVPSFKVHQRKIDEAALPGAAERLEQSAAIAETLIAAGYAQIGLDHFARPDDSLAIAAEAGALHRNFQGYTVDRCSTLIGFGASAIGRLPQGYVQNATRIPDYAERIAAGRLATVRGYRLTDEDRRRAEIIEQLMCRYTADIGSIEAPLDELEADGLIRRDGSIIQVVEEAKPLVRTVAAAFDAYLPKTASQHAPAL